MWRPCMSGCLFSCHLSSGRVLRHSFEIKAPYWNALQRRSFPSGVAAPFRNVTQTWRPYPTQYGAQAAIGGWLSDANFCSIAVISKNDTLHVHDVPGHQELGAYMFQTAAAVAEKQERQLQRFINIYKNHLQNFEIIPRGMDQLLLPISQSGEKKEEDEEEEDEEEEAKAYGKEAGRGQSHGCAKGGRG